MWGYLRLGGLELRVFGFGVWGLGAVGCGIPG